MDAKSSDEAATPRPVLRAADRDALAVHALTVIEEAFVLARALAARHAMAARLAQLRTCLEPLLEEPEDA